MDMHMNWSFQLYSARKFQPWTDIFRKLADLGYSQVEGFGGLYDDPVALRADLDRNGLSMPTSHFSLDMLENDFDGARRIAETLGVGTLICPHIAAEQRPKDQVGWRAFGKRLVAVHENARKAGLRFAWHNHDFEFATMQDGSIPQRTILEAAPEIGWEIDVAWVVRGGVDPLDWIDRYASRIVAVHVKDIASDGQAKDEDGWADVGHGTLDWPRIMATLREKTPAKVFVMEHDNPNDIERFAKRSIEAARNF
jgi:sugar phosphate isomerase/epimerase